MFIDGKNVDGPPLRAGETLIEEIKIGRAASISVTRRPPNAATSRSYLIVAAWRFSETGERYSDGKPLFIGGGSVWRVAAALAKAARLDVRDADPAAIGLRGKARRFEETPASAAGASAEAQGTHANGDRP